MSEQLNQNEIQEWQQAIDAPVDHEGRDMPSLIERCGAICWEKDGLSVATAETPYLTIAPADQIDLPDDGVFTVQLTNIMRWNAAVMVLRAVKRAKELGGHIASMVVWLCYLKLVLNTSSIVNTTVTVVI